MPATIMRTSQDGIEFMESWEKLALVKYKDERGFDTIGYGHKILAGETYEEITEEEANAIFAKDMAWAEKAVNDAITVDIAQSQFDACAALCFNIGAHGFTTSTLVRLINEEDYEGAAGQFERWDHEGGKVSQGLLNRRLAERDIFIDGRYVMHA